LLTHGWPNRATEFYPLYLYFMLRQFFRTIPQELSDFFFAQRTFIEGISLTGLKR